MKKAGSSFYGTPIIDMFPGYVAHRGIIHREFVFMACIGLLFIFIGYLPDGQTGRFHHYLVIQQYLIMGWGNLFPLFGWQPRWAPAPESAVVNAARPKRPETDDAPDEVPAPASNRAPGSGGGRAGTRPANRKQGGAKRRGRKR